MSTTPTTFHPALEPLEERFTPAAVAPAAAPLSSAAITSSPTPTLPPAAPLAQGQSGQSPGQAAPATIDLSAGPEAPRQAVGQPPQASPLFGSPIVLGALGPTAPAGQPPQAAVSGFPLSPGDLQQPAIQAVFGFRGRLAFPGTGVQQRVGVGNGPFDQPPGLYLPGGGDEEGFAVAPRVQSPQPRRVSSLTAQDAAPNDAEDVAVAVDGFSQGNADASSLVLPLRQP